MNSLPRAMAALLARDLRLALRQRSEVLAPVLFLLMVATLFPLGLGPDKSLLVSIAPGVVWVISLLACLLSLNLMFHADMEDGTLDQLIIARWPLPMLALTKVLAHWLVTGLPITIIAPLVATAYGLSVDTIGIMALSLLVGTPILSCIGAIGVALSVGLRRGGMFLSLLVLPLYVPVIIFATAAVAASLEGFSPAASLYLLGAMLVLAVTTAPFAIAAGLRISVA